MKFRKYFRIFFLHIQNSMCYRGYMAIYILNDFTAPILMFLLWLAVYRSSGRTFGYFTLSQTFLYYLFITLTDLLISSYPEEDIGRYHIKEGGLTNLLLKPIPYFKFIFLQELAWRTVRLFLALPFYFLFFLILKKYIIFNLNLTNLAVFILLAPFSYCLYFLFKVSLGLLAFWVEEIGGLINLSSVAIILFGGQIMPLAFFPPLLKTISDFLPFKYFLYFPAAILLGNVLPKEIIGGFFQTAVWLIILFSLYRFLWRKGLYLYTGIGR